MKYCIVVVIDSCVVFTMNIYYVFLYYDIQVVVLTTWKSKEQNRMASNKCGLECETEEGKFHVLSNNEVQILEHRFGFEVNNLCGKHYLDQFKQYKRGIQESVVILVKDIRKL